MKCLLIIVLFTFSFPSFAQTSQSPKESFQLAQKRKKRARKKRRAKRKTKFKKSKTLEVTSQTAPPASLETNVFGVLFGVLNLEYHMPVAEKSTVGAAGYFWGLGSNVSGFGVGALYTLYIDKLYDGLFVTGVGTFSTLSVGELSASGLSFGGIGGYKYNLGPNFSVSGGLGINYFTFSGDLNGFNTIQYAVVINLGIYLH